MSDIDQHRQNGESQRPSTTCRRCSSASDFSLGRPLGLRYFLCYYSQPLLLVTASKDEVNNHDAQWTLFSNSHYRPSPWLLWSKMPTAARRLIVQQAWLARPRKYLFRVSFFFADIKVLHALLSIKLEVLDPTTYGQPDDFHITHNRPKPWPSRRE